MLTMKKFVKGWVALLLLLTVARLGVDWGDGDGWLSTPSK